jgi:hypothetical protein
MAVEAGGMGTEEFVPVDEARANALKRALRQLAGIRHVVPSYKGLHANVWTAVRASTSADDCISGADSEAELSSPIHVSEPVTPEQQRPEIHQPGTPETGPPEGKTAISAMMDKYGQLDEEEEEEQKIVLAASGVRAFLDVIGGFSIRRSESQKRYKKVKKERPPPSPEEQAKAAKLEATVSLVVKKVHDELWHRFGEATQEQKDLLSKKVRRGLRHLSSNAEVPHCVAEEIRLKNATNATVKKLVPYLCGLGYDWESLLAESTLSRQNLHLWSDQDWLKSASGHEHGGGQERADDKDEESDSGESVWELVEDDEHDEEWMAEVKRLTRIRLLHRIVTAYHSGKLLKMLTAYREAHPTKSPYKGSRHISAAPSPAKALSPDRKAVSASDGSGQQKSGASVSKKL